MIRNVVRKFVHLYVAHPLVSAALAVENVAAKVTDTAFRFHDRVSNVADHD